MSDIDRALALLLAHEGGWSDHPADRGGKTMWGVIEATFHGWLASKRRPLRPVRSITMAEAREIYRDLYWNAAGCDRLPWPLSYVVFDAAVNSGPRRATRWLQAGLGVAADGKVGPATVAAARAAMEAGDAAKLLAVVRARADFLADLVRGDPTQAVFLKGWWRRVLDVLARALVDAGGD